MALKIVLRKSLAGDDGTTVDTYFAVEGDWSFEVHIPRGERPTTANVHFEFDDAPDNEDSWCEPCGSYHPYPQTFEHWQELGCKADRREIEQKVGELRKANEEVWQRFEDIVMATDYDAKDWKVRVLEAARQSREDEGKDSSCGV